MIIKKILLLGSLSLASYSSLANDNIQSVIDSFTNCDSSFFYQLKTNADDFADITDLVVKDDIAYIPVKDVTSDEGNTHYFKQPINYRGLKITGYQNIYIKTELLGQYFYWGFVIDGKVDDVKETLSTLPWQQYNFTSYVANPLIYDRQQKNPAWQNNPYVVDGVIPRILTVEKSLYLEPINETQIHLVCSIQGDLTRPLLYSIHPDMEDINTQLDAKYQAELEQQKNTDEQTKVVESTTNNGEI